MRVSEVFCAWEAGTRKLLMILYLELVFDFTATLKAVIKELPYIIYLIKLFIKFKLWKAKYMNCPPFQYQLGQVSGHTFK